MRGCIDIRNRGVEIDGSPRIDRQLGGKDIGNAPVTVLEN